MNRQQRVLLTTWGALVLTLLLVSLLREDLPAASLSLLPLALHSLFHWRDLRHLNRINLRSAEVMRVMPALKSFCLVGYLSIAVLVAWLLASGLDVINALGLLGIVFLVVTPTLPAVVYAQYDLYRRLADY